MRRGWAMLIAALVLVAGCKDERAEYQLEQERERAKKLEEKLSEAEVKKQFTFWHKSTDEKFQDIGFPVQTAIARCKGESIRVLYNPYRDLVIINLAKDDAADEQLRTLSLDGKVVFKKKEAFVGEDTLLTFKEQDGGAPSTDQRVSQRERGTTLKDLTKEHAAIFKPDETVTFAVSGTSMVSKNLPNKKFTYLLHRHGGWKVTLHVFDEAMAKKLSTHVTLAKHGATELHVLSWYARDVEFLRKSELEEAKAILKRYDELEAEAKKKQQEAGDMPYAEHVDALKIVHEPPCAG